MNNQALLEQCTSRDHFGNLLNELGLTGEGVEVGVCEGGYSEILLRTWKGTRLHLVDPWKELEDYHDMTNALDSICEERFQRTALRLQEFGDRFEIHRKLSTEAASEFAPESLDFVYIDANHDYEHALEDIRLWSPKLRKGGLLAGHDYCDGCHYYSMFGVKSAVTEFLNERNFTLHLTQEDPISWFFLV